MTFLDLSAREKAAEIARLILDLKATSSVEKNRSNELQRQRDKRSEAARIFIPEPANIQRRERCLEDPELFLKTYFAKVFYNPFARHHLAMIDAIWERAHSGGDKAIAAPRGDGKTQVTIGMAVCITLATPIRFPVLIGNTLSKGKKLFKQFKSKFENASKFPEFHADFPEVCVPIKSLEGAPQRAAKQHVDGVLTRITWSQELVVMPTVKCDWVVIPAGGKRLTYFGLDSAIRGEGFEEDRPDFAIIDDPETREVAFSPTDRHQSIEEMIDGDVAGLSGPDKRISRVVLTTIQNRRCYSFRVTNPKVKPSFEGERHALLTTWPENKELWNEYLALRQKDQTDGQKDGPTATQFYRDNMEAMQAGAVLSNPYRFVSETNSAGDAVELDALQAFYNRVSDWGLPRVLAELQQEPEEEEEAESTKLPAGTVAGRMSGLQRNELPKAEGLKIVYSIDMGKHSCHWVKLACTPNCIINVVDYGILENPGMEHNTTPETVEQSLLNRLNEFRIDLMTGDHIPDLVFIDSGTFTAAVYEFCRQAGAPFLPVKGQPSTFRFTGEDKPESRYFEGCRADFQHQARLWLYHIDGIYWKNQVHQRFRTATFNEAHQIVDGSLSVFAVENRKEHLSFSHHVVAEHWMEQFESGKGLRKKWVQVNRNNHWLDAMAYGLAGASCLGFQLLKTEQTMERLNQSVRPQPSQSNPSPFRTRPGGWIKGLKR